MNTKNKRDQKKQGQTARQEHRPKKQGRNSGIQEHEHPEMRLTR